MTLHYHPVDLVSEELGGGGVGDDFLDVRVLLELGDEVLESGVVGRV